MLKSILDPGDEVIVLNPYFPEYRFCIENHGGRVVTVETGADFQPNIGRIAAALTPRTKALILNSPNNPTGALRELNGIIREPVPVISDEPVPPAGVHSVAASGGDPGGAGVGLRTRRVYAAVADNSAK